MGGNYGNRRRYLGRQTLDGAISMAIQSQNAGILDEIKTEMEAREKKNRIMNGIRNRLGNIALSARGRANPKSLLSPRDNLKDAPKENPNAIKIIDDNGSSTVLQAQNSYEML